MAQQRDLSLEKAVLEFTPTSYCNWFTSGDVINYRTIKNVDVTRIGVFWTASKAEFSITLATHGLESKLNILSLGDFSSLDEIRGVFPQLFKVTGNLNVY